MPERRRGDARAGVGQAGRLEERLDRAVLAERAVEGDEDDRRRVARRRAGRGRRRARAGRRRRARPDRRRSAAGRPSRRWSAGSHHQPPSRSMRTCSTSCPRRPGPRRWPSRRRARRRARPTGRRAGRRPAAGPVARSRSPATASRTSRRGTRSRTRARRRARRADHGPDVLARRRTSAAVPFWSLTMKLACFSDTTRRRSAWPLSPAAVDQPAGRVVRRVAEDAAGRRQAERLVGLAPAADVVEPRLDRRPGRPARAGRSRRRRARRGRRRGGVLEPAVAVGQAEVRGAARPPRCRRWPRTRADSRTPAMSASWAPALAQTAPPTVPGMASPNSRPDRPGPLGLGRRPGHRQAGLGGVAVALDAEPSARSWMTRPRTPRSLMTRSLPRPSTRCGSSRARAKRTRRAQLEDVVHGGEQVGRAADAHRREPRQRLVARGLDADPALDVGADRRSASNGARPTVTRHAARAARAPLDRRRVGQRLAARRRRARARRRRRRRPAGRARGPRRTSRAWAAGSSRMAAASSSAAASKAVVLDEPGRAGLDQLAGVRPLVPGGVRVRDDDHRQAQRGHLGQRRRAGPADDEVGGGQRRQHLVAQERMRPVALAQLRGQRLAAGQGRGIAVVAGDVDDGDPLDEPRQRLGDGAR